MTAAGVFAVVGNDVIEMRRHHGTTWVSIDAVTALEVPVALPAAGPALDGARMDEVLDGLAEERTEVVLTLDGGNARRCAACWSRWNRGHRRHRSGWSHRLRPAVGHRLGDTTRLDDAGRPGAGTGPTLPRAHPARSGSEVCRLRRVSV